MIVIWQIISAIINNNLIFPSITLIVNKVIIIFMSENFIHSVFSSIYRCFLATLISISISFVFGILSYKNKYIYNFCYPILSIIRSLPTMAFIAIALIWFSKEYAPILIAVLISLPIFYDMIIGTLLELDKSIIKMCRVYRVPRKKVFTEIYIMKIFLSLINIMSSTLSLVFKVIIAGELYSQPKYGVGAAIQFEKMQLNTDSIIAWIIIITVISIIFDKIIYILRRKIYKFERIV